jgi:glycogen operon protein
MGPEDWADRSSLAVGIYLDGSDDPDRAPDGTPLLDDDFLVLVNAWWEDLSFTVPLVRESAAAWYGSLDTYDPGAASGYVFRTGDAVPVRPRSVVVLRAPRAVG